MHTIISPVWNLQKDTPTPTIYFFWLGSPFFLNLFKKQTRGSLSSGQQPREGNSTHQEEEEKKEKSTPPPPKSCGDNNNKKRLDSFQYF